MDSGRNDFERLVRVIAASTQKLSQNATQLKKMVGQLGTQHDTADFRKKLQQIQESGHNLSIETSSKMKELQKLVLKTDKADERQKKLQKDRLMNDLSQVLKQLQEAQTMASRKVKEIIRTSQNSESIENEARTSLLSPEERLQMQMEHKADVALLREREEAVQKLEEDMVLLNDIFRDLGTMVHEQGGAVDSIEANVVSVHMQVTEGTQQLTRAAALKNSVRKKKVIIFAIVIIILVIIAIILIVQLR